MQFVDSPAANAYPQINQDEANVRIVHTRFGFDVRLERRDPYGFVYIAWNKGPTPALISGAYSDFDKARGALNSYLNSDTFNYIVEEPVVVEPLVYKRKPKEIKE